MKEWKTPSGGPQHRIRKVKGGIARVLKPEHPAIVDRTALFRKGIEHASTSPRLLVDGINQCKVGQRITKGAWKGTRIFTLTLVERATCPTSCQQWLSCYGNGMPYARRHILDRALIARLGPEIAGLIAKHGRIAVRLHVLGDFGTEEDLDLAIAYVAAWRWAMMQHEGLHLFGYTAHAPAGAIGRAIHALNVDFPARCRIRFSGQDMGAYGAIVIERPEEAKSVVCPAQTDATDCRIPAAWGRSAAREYGAMSKEPRHDTACPYYHPVGTRCPHCQDWTEGRLYPAGKPGEITGWPWYDEASSISPEAWDALRVHSEGSTTEIAFSLQPGAVNGTMPYPQTDEWGMSEEEWRWERWEYEQERRRDRWKALKALWLRPVPSKNPSQYVANESGRGDDWTFPIALATLASRALQERWIDHG